MQALRIHRAKRGLTLRKLGELADVEVNTLIRMERGERSYLTTIYKVANALGIEPEEVTEFYHQIHTPSEKINNQASA